MRTLKESPATPDWKRISCQQLVLCKKLAPAPTRDIIRSLDNERISFRFNDTTDNLIATPGHRAASWDDFNCVREYSSQDKPNTSTSTKACLKRIDQELNNRMNSLCQEVQEGQDSHQQQTRDLRRHLDSHSAEITERFLAVENQILINQRRMDHMRDA